MKRIFHCQVTKLGEEVEELLALNTIVIFGEEALSYYGSPELSSICVMHDFAKPPYFKVTKGSVFCVGDVKMEILAVGQAVDHNLKNYGHATFKLLKEGETQTLKPGDVQVRFVRQPVLEIGTKIEILRSL